MMATRLRRSDFAEHYALMGDEAIIRLSSEYGSLVEGAREALDEEIRKRNLVEARKAVDVEMEKGTQYVTPTEPGVSSALERRVSNTGNADPNGSERGPYVGLTILLVFIALSMTMSVFTILSSITDASSAENAGRSVGGQFIPWLVGIIWAGSIWKGIRRRATDGRSKALCRRFGRVAGIVFVGLIAVAAALGVWNSGRVSRANQVRKLAADIAESQPKGVEFSRRLDEIRSKETPTYRDYYKQCLEVEALLNESEDFRSHSRQAAVQLRDLVSGDAKYAQKFDDVLAVQEKDAAIITDLRREIADSRELVALPVGAQAAYYSANIVPLQKEEERLADEEASILGRLRVGGAQ